MQAYNTLILKCIISKFMLVLLKLNSSKATKKSEKAHTLKHWKFSHMFPHGFLWCPEYLKKKFFQFYNFHNNVKGGKIFFLFSKLLFHPPSCLFPCPEKNYEPTALYIIANPHKDCINISWITFFAQISGFWIACVQRQFLTPLPPSHEAVRLKTI